MFYIPKHRSTLPRLWTAGLWDLQTSESQFHYNIYLLFSSQTLLSGFFELQIFLKYISLQSSKLQIRINETGDHNEVNVGSEKHLHLWVKHTVSPHNLLHFDSDQFESRKWTEEKKNTSPTWSWGFSLNPDVTELLVISTSTLTLLFQTENTTTINRRQHEIHENMWEVSPTLEVSTQTELKQSKCSCWSSSWSSQSLSTQTGAASTSVDHQDTAHPLSAHTPSCYLSPQQRSSLPAVERRRKKRADKVRVCRDSLHQLSVSDAAHPG